ncbi:hypothetical protein [Dyella flagellata]|uniref:Uncharacterized protein n=1 Tax=Dyella flagellata TaxID=1867833 RepID=A0ABQ5X9Q3_9GAMM|nr:hypothetical protein [Dyella flagellata]GLQ87984.1 hypothetical protein GCM10007898_15520 [Dyella flagellata]
MSRTPSFAVVLSSMSAAVQWRLLLLWLLIMLIPVALVALPLWTMLGGLLDTSVHSAEWAQGFNDIMFGDVITSLSDHPQWLLTGMAIAQATTLLLSPFLTGMVIGSGRAGRTLGFAALLQSGLVEYGRMFRLLLWALIPYGLVIAVHLLGSHLADKHTEQAVLESQADRYADIAHWVLIIVFVLMQSIVESARAAFIADPSLRSATRALGRGIKQWFRHPVKTLLFYLVVTLVGMVLASVFGLLRIHVTAIGLAGTVLAVLLAQLIVLAFGWMRTARLFALAEVARVVAP